MSLVGRQDKTLELVTKLLEGIRGLEELKKENKELKETVELQQKEISALHQNSATKEELRAHVGKFKELGTRCAEYENITKNQG